MPEDTKPNFDLWCQDVAQTLRQLQHRISELEQELERVQEYTKHLDPDNET